MINHTFKHRVRNRYYKLVRPSWSVVFVLRAGRTDSEPVSYRRVESWCVSMATNKQTFRNDLAVRWPLTSFQHPAEFVSAIDAEPDSRNYLRELIALAADAGLNER